MYLEFVEAFGKHTAGTITDEYSDGLGAELIKEGKARASSAASFQRSIEDSRFEKLRTDLFETVKGAFGDAKNKTKGPPNGGGALVRAIGSTSMTGEDQHGEEMSRKEFEAQFRDCCRSLFHARAQGVDPALARKHTLRMRNYTDSYTEYKEKEDGTEEVVTTRNMADGGIETTIRSGSDSLSGGVSYGFTLKPTFVANLFEIARETEIFAQFTQPVPVTSGNEAIWPGLQQFQAPTVLNGIPQSAIFGGITMSFVGEETPRVSSDAKVFQNKFHVEDLTGLTDFSHDYIMDSSSYIPMDSVVTRKFADAHAWIKDWTFIRGDGVGKPQGFFNANAAITGGPSSGARYNSNQISADDLAWMLSKCHAMCLPDARFIASITTFPQLYVLLNHSGTAVFQPNAMISQDMLLSITKGSYSRGMIAMAGGMVLGHPIWFSEKMPTLGTTGDICLVCPYQYGDATKLEFEMGMSEHVYFLTDRVAYRTKSRFYGRSLWPAPYTQADNITTPASGTQTTPFVILHS
jgi:HK97 family phage major capsid protein